MAPDIATPWLSFKGFEACVVVNNVPVYRFGEEYEELRDQAIAWIPSEADKTFAVYYRKTILDGYDYCMTLFLDGIKATCAVAQNSSGTALHRISSIKVSPTETRNFLFNSAALTDDDTYLDNCSSMGFGEIKVVFEAARIVTETKPPDNFHSEAIEREKVHEAMYKGLVHQIGYENKTTRSYETPRKWLQYQQIGSPVTLIFKYRSLDVLRANGIVPRPTPADDDEAVAEHSSSKNQSSVEEPPETTRNRTILSPEIKREETVTLKEESDEESESEEEETDQIVIRSLQALLLKLKKAASRKRARKEASQTSEVKKEGANVDLIATEATEADPAPSEEADAPPHKKAKKNCTTPEVIDLTHL